MLCWQRSIGGLVGFVLAVLTVLGHCSTAGDRMRSRKRSSCGLRPLDWVLLAGVAVIAACWLMAVVRATALWGLLQTAVGLARTGRPA